VKLTSWSDLVKPDREVLTVAAVTVLLTAGALQIVASLTDQTEARIDQFGTAAAQVMAEMAVEPMLKQDRMHLGVIGNRLADLPQIDGVASFTLDNQVLASTGNTRKLEYAQPVSIDGDVVGYVRVSVDPEAFDDQADVRLMATLPTLLLLPFAIAIGWGLTKPGRRQELVARLPRLSSPWISGRVPAPEASQVPAEPEPDAPDVTHYLLAVNLYNQLSLPATERDFELSLCVELAESVAEVFDAEVMAQSGLGAVVVFDHNDDPDRPFEVLSAALVLARLLREEAPFGIYRLGLNLAVCSADEPLSATDDAVTDARLLSALAKDSTLAVSEPFFAALEGQERVVMKPLANPLLDELATSGTGCWLVTDLDPPHAALVVQRAEQLRTQREGIASPSTF
jgi:uncharacterized membrane protein affecting hemolysin expression